MYVSFYCMFPLFLIVSCIFFIILYYVYDFIINSADQKTTLIHSLANCQKIDCSDDFADFQAILQPTSVFYAAFMRLIYNYDSIAC